MGQSNREAPHSPSKGAGVGFIGGLTSVITMTILILGMDSMMGLPSDAFFTMMGVIMGARMAEATGVGLGLHIMTGSVIGVIFGVAVTVIRPLRASSLGRGVVFGIIGGAVVWAILFLPMVMTVIPPSMFKLMTAMNPSAPESMIMDMAMAMVPTILVGGFAIHLVFGFILGAVTGLILPKYGVK